MNPESHKIKIVVSDLHMGFGRVTAQGMVNDMEDFVSDQAFADLLEFYHTGEFVDAEVEVVLNGDVFEGLVALDSDEAPDLITEEKSVEKIQAIVGAHAEVFRALRAFQEGENRQVTFIVGNHDQDLYWESIRDLLREKIHPEIRFIDDAYVFDGVHIEHGHQQEHQNRIDPRRVFLTRGFSEPVLNLPWGSDMFVNVLLPIKRLRPYVNRVRPLRLFATWSLWHDFFGLVRFAWLFVRAVFRARFRAQRQRRVSFLQTLRVVFGSSAFPTLQPEATRILLQDQSLHTVIFGHTHIPLWRQVLPGRTYVNSGSWIPTSNLHISALGLSKLQTYAFVEYEDGVPRARLKLWHGRRVVEEDLPM